MTSWRRFRGLFGLEPARDVEDEIAFHLELTVRELVERGESPERARELALQRFGDYQQARAECVAIEDRRKRRRLRAEFFGERWQDVRFALRMFRRAPGVAGAAILTLALGIGANAAIFSLFSQILLQPLAVEAPQQLVNLVSPGLRPGWKSCVGGCDAVFSYPMFRDLERLQTVFTGLAAHRDLPVNLGHRGQTITGTGLLVSGRYFPMLGLRPALGRLLGPEDDDTLGEPDVVVLSHAYWQSQLGGRPDVVGETLVVNGHPLTIVGVASRGFEGTTRGMRRQVFLPITLRWRMLPRTPAPDNRDGYWLYLLARLRPGIERAQAQAALDAPYRAIINQLEAPLLDGLSERQVAEFRARGLQLESGSRGHGGLLAEARAPLTLLLGVTALVLLIACVNVANLLLARSAARAREFATRLSIGASRGRLIAQLLTESSVLAAFGGVASLLVAFWTLGLVRWLLTSGDGGPELPLQLDGAAIAVTAVLAFGTSLAVGIAPALQAARPDLVTALKAQSGQAAAGSRRTVKLRTGLAAAQMTASMVLLVLAGLFAKSLANMHRVDPGMDTSGIVTFGISPQRNGYELPRSRALFDRLEEDLVALPGVTAAASSTTALLAGSVRMTSVVVEGFSAGPGTDDDSRYDEVGPGYFRALGIPVRAGREFTRTDAADAPKVAVVNEAFARKFGLGRDAVGKRMGIMGVDGPPLDIEIVGVVPDFNHSNLRTADAPIYFVPHRQGSRQRPGIMTFYVRSRQPPEQMMPAIRQVVGRHDPNLPVEDLRTMDEQVGGAMVRERLLGVLTGAFAALAVLVSAVGLYGVLAYAVSQRTPEIGLRMALGATRAGVRWMVLRHVGLIAAIGGALGLALALPLARAAQALLFGLEFADATVLAGATLALGLVALAAAYVPAARAARIDPMRALKYE